MCLASYRSSIKENILEKYSSLNEETKPLVIAVIIMLFLSIPLFTFILNIRIPNEDEYANTTSSVIGEDTYLVGEGRYIESGVYEIFVGANEYDYKTELNFKRNKNDKWRRISIEDCDMCNPVGTEIDL